MVYELLNDLNFDNFYSTIFQMADGVAVYWVLSQG